MSRTIVIDDAIVAKALRRLRRAAKFDHSGRPFLEHLLCTWRILVAWRMPPEVCRAGFLHSAYSTSYYGKALFRLDQRETVRDLIGARPEALVFHFCTVDRGDLWDALANRRRVSARTHRVTLRSGAQARVGTPTLEKLLIIESANIAEQIRAKDGGPAPWMSWLMGWWDFLSVEEIPLSVDARPRLTPKADENAVELYRRALGAPLRRAMPLLEDAIGENPWAAEPKLLSAVCALESSAPDSAMRAASAADLLSRWGVAWDKRLTLEQWNTLATRVRIAATPERGSSGVSYDSMRAVLAGRVRKPRWLAV